MGANRKIFQKKVKMMDKLKDKKFKIFISLFLLLSTVIVGFSVRACGHNSDVRIVKKPPLNLKKYNILAENWNRSVMNARLSSSYDLPESDPEEMIKALNTFIRPFYEFLSPDIERELEGITQGWTYSFFVFYFDFLKKHRISNKVEFATEQESLEIKKVIKQLTKEDGVNTRAVTIIASIDNPCLFLDKFKDELYKKGMLRNIRSCKDLVVDKGKYPNLYELVNKGE